MKKSFYVILLLVFSLNSGLHGQIEYLFIDNHSKSAPDSISNYRELAYYLTNNFREENEKIRSLYIWITHNIKYDLEKYRRINEREAEEVDLAEVLKRRKGICQDYSELFHAMSQCVGIESYIISGMTRGANGELSSEGHAWNGVRIDTAYYLLDLTWSAGYVNNGNYFHEFQDKYFLTLPQEMIKSHLPYDPIWQFLDNPISIAEYQAYDYRKLNERGAWNYSDSISIYKDSKKIERLEKMSGRMERSNLFNDDKRNLKIVKDELFYVKYSLVIEHLNAGIDNYNKYINFRNNKFRKPKIEDSQLEEMILEAKYELKEADKLLKEMNAETTASDESINELLDKMPAYISDVEKAEDFINRYLNTWKVFRIFIM